MSPAPAQAAQVRRAAREVEAGLRALLRQVDALANLAAGEAEAPRGPFAEKGPAEIGEAELTHRAKEDDAQKQPRTISFADEGDPQRQSTKGSMRPAVTAVVAAEKVLAAKNARNRDRNESKSGLASPILMCQIWQIS